MDGPGLIRELTTQGFAVGVAAYLLVRLESRLEALTRSIDCLCERTALAATPRDEAPR